MKKGYKGLRFNNMRFQSLKYEIVFLTLEIMKNE